LFSLSSVKLTYVYNVCLITAISVDNNTSIHGIKKAKDLIVTANLSESLETVEIIRNQLVLPWACVMGFSFSIIYTGWPKSKGILTSFQPFSLYKSIAWSHIWITYAKWQYSRRNPTNWLKALRQIFTP
jgi:hypothetical protein